MIKISSVQEVLSQFNDEVIDLLNYLGFKLPDNALSDIHESLTALIRIQHRSISNKKRKVHWSNELKQKQLSCEIKQALNDIQKEIEDGKDLNHRLTRRFFEAKFNDFLLNNFKIQHFHLGKPGCLWTGKNEMCKNLKKKASKLLLTFITEEEVYFIDVQNHDVFKNADQVKELLQIILKNWKFLLDPFICKNVISMNRTFEQCFKSAQQGFATGFQLYNTVFTIGGTVFDKRVYGGAATSIEVGLIVDKILTRIRLLIEWVTKQSNILTKEIEGSTGRSPVKISLKVDKVDVDGEVLLIDGENHLRVSEQNGKIIHVIHS